MRRIDKMDWNKIYEYRDGELYWKTPAKIGNKAGCYSRGYLRCRYKGKIYQGHRIIYEMHHGKIRGGYFIDHIDGNTLNNKIENIRLVTPLDNNRNMALRRASSSGFTGVCWEKAEKKYGFHSNHGRPPKERL